MMGNLRLSRKMVLVYLLLVGFTCGTAIVALQMTLKIYDEQLYEKSQQELDFFSQQVNDKLNDIEKMSLSIAVSLDIQDQIIKMQSVRYLSSDYYYELMELRRLLQNKIITDTAVKNVIYTDGSQISITVGADCGPVRQEKMDGILKDYEKVSGRYVFYSPTEEYPYLLSGRNIRMIQNARLDYLGSLLFTTDISDFLAKEADRLQAEHSRLFVYSEEGMIYQEERCDGLELPSMEQERGYRIIKQNGTKMFLCYEKSEATGWMYVNLFPYSEIFGKTMAVKNAMFIGFVIIFIFTLFILKRTAGVITRPLEQLSESMKIVETGDFGRAREAIPGEKREDEVGTLTQEFGVMLDKIDFLIHENYEKQILLKDTKYKMLQAQINPHFLYNTLNALSWMVRAGRNRESVKMITELGKLLRASFAKDPYTTVEEEVETARSYMTIQQFRYQSRIEFLIQTEGCLSDYIVPRMILQPLIENAIYYGAEKSLECCQIRVYVREEENFIRFSVEDQGPGMNEEELRNVRSGNFKPNGHGIGLTNIRERLHITYDDSEFDINSQVGKGTQIEIRIPKVSREDGYV